MQQSVESSDSMPTSQPDDHSLSSSNSSTDQLCERICDDLIEEALIGLFLQVHRSSKLGLLFLDETVNNENHRCEIVDRNGLDVFGQSAVVRKQYECQCPSCQRTLSAQRFAPHLEKCMGMGRNSSRIASKRIASSVSIRLQDDSDSEEICTRRSKKKKTSRKHTSISNGTHSV